MGFRIFKKIKCKECSHFEWEDEVPNCTFGICDVEDIDDFEPFSIHEKNRMCYIPTIEVQIKFNGPYDSDYDLENINWFCPENIQLALRKVCKNTRFEIKYSKRCKRALSKLRRKLEAT